jgi:hypothetical protein
MRRLTVLVALAFVAAACGRQANVGVGSSPSPSASSSPVGSGTATPCVSGSPCPEPSHPSPSPTPQTEREWTLRYRLLDHYTNFAYCDPDFFPVAREGGEQANADDWWPRNRTTPEARAILAHHHWTEPLDAPKRLGAYRDHKKLTVIQMGVVAGGYDFTLSISTSDKGVPDTTVEGTISKEGTVVERSRTPRAGGCPICLEGVTRIATPHGAIEVSRIHAGDLVYSVDGSGHRVTVRVERVVRRETPGPHLMVRLALGDGRVLVAAGAHPAAGGRLLRDLHTRERYDGSIVSSISYVESSAPATYDILPAGVTGDYWANGILLGSTLES